MSAGIGTFNIHAVLLRGHNHVATHDREASQWISTRAAGYKVLRSRSRVEPPVIPPRYLTLLSNDRVPRLSRELSSRTGGARGLNASRHPRSGGRQTSQATNRRGSPVAPTGTNSTNSAARLLERSMKSAHAGPAGGGTRPSTECLGVRGPRPTLIESPEPNSSARSRSRGVCARRSARPDTGGRRMVATECRRPVFANTEAQHAPIRVPSSTPLGQQRRNQVVDRKSGTGHPTGM